MANESICRGCFHSYVCEQFNEHRNSNNQKCHFLNDHFVSAADVVEVVHGRWSVQRIKSVDSVEISKCSVCNYPAATMWGRTNYCPNCGARMDGE